MAKRKMWTKTAIVDCIRARHSSGKPINLRDIQRQIPALYTCARREFGTWKAAIEAAGFNYDQVICGEKWDADKVTRRIRCRNDQDETLRPAETYRVDCALFAAACRYYGTWRAAVEAAGIDYDAVMAYETWDRSKVLRYIHDRIQDNVSLRVVDVQSDDHALYGAACNYFGSWEKAIEAAGVDYREVCQFFREKDLRSQLGNVASGRLRKLGSARKSNIAQKRQKQKGSRR